MTLLTNLGSFDSIDTVWKTYPYGGKEGDFTTINGVIFVWNKYSNTWEKYSDSGSGDDIASPNYVHIFRFDAQQDEGAGVLGWCWFSINQTEKRRQVDFMFIRDMGLYIQGAIITAGYDNEKATFDEIKNWTEDQFAALWREDILPESSAWTFHSSSITDIKQISNNTKAIEILNGDATTQGSVKQQIAAALAGLDTEGGGNTSLSTINIFKHGVKHEVYAPTGNSSFQIDSADQLCIHAIMDTDDYRLYLSEDQSLGQMAETFLHDGINSVPLWQWSIVVEDNETSVFLEQAVLQVINITEDDHLKLSFQSRYSHKIYEISISLRSDDTFGEATVQSSDVSVPSGFRWIEVE